MKCLQCQKEFTQTPGYNIYCSLACRKTASEKKRKKKENTKPEEYISEDNARALLRQVKEKLTLWIAIIDYHRRIK